MSAPTFQLVIVDSLSSLQKKETLSVLPHFISGFFVNGKGKLVNLFFYTTTKGGS